MSTLGRTNGAARVAAALAPAEAAPRARCLCSGDVRNSGEGPARPRRCAEACRATHLSGAGIADVPVAKDAAMLPVLRCCHRMLRCCDAAIADVPVAKDAAMVPPTH